ncbi:MAG: N-acetylmuramoyl-L-alanine amidase [Gaiellaceae bacterium]
MSDRPFPQVKVRRDVACQSKRDGRRPVLIVVHSTEGQNQMRSIRDLEGLAAFFDRLPTQASAHVATDADGFSARMVPDSRKAWSCVDYNAISLNIEQIGFAVQKTWKDAELRETARWIARWHREHHIPIQRGAVLAGGKIKPGVVGHQELGELGGGHHDPANPFPGSYPLTRVLELAHHYVRLQEAAA